MAIQYLSMDDARAQVQDELERFLSCRVCGFDTAQAARAIGVTPATGTSYEHILRQLLDLAANTIDPAPGALTVIRARTQKTTPEAPGAVQETDERHPS